MMDFNFIDQFLNVNAYYAITFVAEALFAIWVLRIRSKVEKHQIMWEAHNEDAKEEAQLKSSLLAEYQTRDKLQTEKITKLESELGYYKGKAGVPLTVKRKKKNV
jgi:hypothetical protein